jgi:hypothetical protein
VTAFYLAGAGCQEQMLLTEGILGY